jgi:hypothetical protein
MSHRDRDYLLARAAQERALAEQAKDQFAREAHERLAHAYEVRANISEVTAKGDNDVIGLTSDGGHSS